MRTLSDDSGGKSFVWHMVYTHYIARWPVELGINFFGV
jgi:hypothetical protein